MSNYHQNISQDEEQQFTSAHFGLYLGFTINLFSAFLNINNAYQQSVDGDLLTRFMLIGFSAFCAVVQIYVPFWVNDCLKEKFKLSILPIIFIAVGVTVYSINSTVGSVETWVNDVNANSEKITLINSNIAGYEKQISDIDKALEVKPNDIKLVNDKSYINSLLSKERNKKIAEIDSNKNTENSDNSFLSSVDKYKYYGALFLEFLSFFLVFKNTRILRKREARKQKIEVIKSEINNKNNAQDNSQVILIQLLNNISDKLNSIENKQNSYPLSAPASAAISAPASAVQSHDKSIESGAFKSASSLASTEIQAHGASTQKSIMGGFESASASASASASKLAASSAARAKKTELENVEIAHLILAMDKPSERELMRKFKIGEPRLKKILLLVDDMKNRRNKVVSLFSI